MTTGGAGDVHPIELRSYAILRGRVDLSHLDEGRRAVIERMIHATADESFATTALIGDTAVTNSIAALRRAAAVVCDAKMVVAGIPAVASNNPVLCYLDRIPAVTTSADDVTAEPPTRSSRAIHLAASEHPDGALWVIGNAPTALDALVELCESGAVRPAAIVGLPVGYVGAAEAKRRLWTSDLRAVAITNEGPRGGSAVAASVVNALLRLAAL